MVLRDGLSLLGQRLSQPQRRGAMVMGFLAYSEICSRRRGETGDRQHKGDRESKYHRAIVTHGTICSGSRTDRFTCD